MDDSTEIGPLASEQILNDVHEQVQKSIAAGAKLLTGGNRIHGAGFFYEPTVLVDVPKTSPAYREEIFGPVASIFRVRDSAEAIEIANDTTFGLGASAWTNDDKERERFINELEAGMVFAVETYCPASDGVSAARIEEEVIVTPKGAQIITLFPADELPIANRY